MKREWSLIEIIMEINMGELKELFKFIIEIFEFKISFVLKVYEFRYYVFLIYFCNCSFYYGVW